VDSRATLARIKLIPEPVVRTLETTFTLVKTLVTEGPMAAWEQLKEIASEMKDAFIDAVKDWIKWQLVQKAIETLLTMLIPGLGLIRAIVGIYDTIVFFIQRAKDIMQMISDFLNSIAAIAAGNIGAAAAALEAVDAAAPARPHRHRRFARAGVPAGSILQHAPAAPDP